MSDYQQPPFYRFNEDSIALSNYVISNTKKYKHIADFCCGCGVVGIEIARCSKPQSLTLVEIQSDYEQSIKVNLNRFLYDQRTSCEVFIEDAAKFKSARKFDLVVMNPPYFNSLSSRPSPDSQRNKCRLYEEGELFSLLLNALSHLEDNGELYFVIREDLYSEKELDKLRLSSEFNMKRVLQRDSFSLFVITISN